MLTAKELYLTSGPRCMYFQRFTLGWALLLALIIFPAAPKTDEFQKKLQPVFARYCVKCHGGSKIKGKINLKEITDTQALLGQPILIKELIDVLDSGDMPPEDENALPNKTRSELISTLKGMLKTSAKNQIRNRNPPRRLNRFQYNNAIRDLFKLNRNIFSLPEKLMTRETIYLTSPRMPEKVNTRSHALAPSEGMRGVKPFPQDLRASHGFDNQANQLTLSPLLFDSFLRLSVSIVESPDFNKTTVGIWEKFFEAPAEDADVTAETKNRIATFLRHCFRSPVENHVITRYTNYALDKLKQGMPYHDVMKKVSSAALSSPMFLFCYQADNTKLKNYSLASNLSFFLWGSIPDSHLLDLAESGDLARPDVLKKTISRMMADPKIERFLDSFPSQWMQLENILSATPDPKQHRLFSIDKAHPASLQMLIEPLLLFDTVFVENRPIIELITPSFSYRSDFLNLWYGSDLKPQKVNAKTIEEDNKPIIAALKAAEAKIKIAKSELDEYSKNIPSIIEEAARKLDLSESRAKWENSQKKILETSTVLSPWRKIGPFQSNNLKGAHERAFINETNVNLEKTHGKLKWELAKNLEDGKVHQLIGSNCSTYLYRIIHSGEEHEQEFSIGSDDSFKIWLNGELIANRFVTRGIAPDQDKIKVRLIKGENELLFKVSNGGGGYGFYFRTKATPLPSGIITALQVAPDKRSAEQQSELAKHFFAQASELKPIREKTILERKALNKILNQAQEKLNKMQKPRDPEEVQKEINRRFDDEIRNNLRSNEFVRVNTKNPRYGGIITSAAMLSMNNGTLRTHPIARGAWVIEVIFNDPPPPPPNDIPPLNEDAAEQHLTIREKFAKHRENPDCAGCHARLDPLGFALENFDITGRWRDKYPNGREVDATGKLLRKYPFKNIVEFKESIAKEDKRFAKAFTSHLLRFALSRELSPSDSLVIDRIVDQTKGDNFRLKTLITKVIKSDSFLENN